jgi:hypothetical protein
MTLGTNEAFEAMLAQMLEGLTLKVGQLLDADRVSLMLGDDARAKLRNQRMMRPCSGRPGPASRARAYVRCG